MESNFPRGQMFSDGLDRMQGRKQLWSMHEFSVRSSNTCFSDGSDRMQGREQLWSTHEFPMVRSSNTSACCVCPV